MNNMQLTIESSTTSMDLNDHQTGIYLVPELDGMTGLPEIRTSSGVNAGYDGGWTSAQNYDARLITIRGVIAHPVVSTVETIRRQLVSLVGQGRKEALTLRLTTEAGNVYTVFVRTIACTMALQRVLTSQEFQIQFRADDPLIYDDGASSGTAGILRVQRALGGFEINFNLPLFIGGGSTGTPIENGGSETVYPIINLYGPLHSPTVINSTTNQQMQLLADLAYEDNWQTPATASGSSFQITGIEGAPLTLTELKGNATQNGTPTPDAPVAVQTTTGENVVKITGKNLFDKNNYNILNCWPTSSSIAHGNNWSIWIPCEPNTTYSVTKMICQPTDHDRFRIVTTAVEPNYGVAVVNAVNPGSGNTTGQITTGATAKYLMVVLENTDTAPTTTLPEMLGSVQIEKGSTATPYQAYTEQDYEVNLGKNLSPTASINNVTWASSSVTALKDVLNSLQAGTYSISMNFTLTERNDTSDASKYGLYLANSGGNLTDNAHEWGDSPVGTTKHYSKTFTISQSQVGNYSTVHLYGCGITGTGATGKANVTEIQIELGQPTTYAPYFTPIELAKIGNYQDRIYKNDGKWYIEKQVGKYTLDGSSDENWYLSQNALKCNALNAPTSQQYGQGYAPNNTNYNLNNTSLVAQASNLGVAIRADQALAGTKDSGVGLSSYANGGGTTDAIYIAKGSYTLASWKTLIQATPLICYYALATPTTTEITNTTLLSQLNFIANLYGGTNNITLVGTGAQGEIGVEYMTENDIRRDVAVVDSQARTITINGSDAYHLKADGSEFITIAPGTNDMSLTSAQTSDEGYAEIKYKQGYLSI